MIRNEIDIAEEQDRLLDQLARIRQVPKEDLIRLAITQMLADDDAQQDFAEARARALSVIGQFRSDCTDVSERHDAYLADAYAE